MAAQLSDEMVTSKSQEANLTHTSTTSQLLEDSLLHELTRALGLPQTQSIKSLVHLIFGRATRRFSELALGLDRVIAQRGSMAGVRWLLPHFVAGYEARGEEIIPRDGPLLIVSNHPASYDVW